VTTKVAMFWNLYKIKKIYKNFKILEQIPSLDDAKRAALIDIRRLDRITVISQR